MDVQKIYSQALKHYKEKNFDAALKILDDLKRLAPNFKQAYMLEVFILKDCGKFFKEFAALTSLLPRFKISSLDDKNFVVHMLNRLGEISLDLALNEESLEFFLLAAKLSENAKEIRNSLSSATAAANASEKFSAANFHELCAEYKKTLSDIAPYPKKFYAHEKIRVGFISADFVHHSLMNWGWALLTKLDKNFFAVYCYSNGKISDIVTEYFRSWSSGWREISDLSDEEVAKLIRDDEIDILFDLSGHTRGNRLPVAAYRPASVQISGIGHINSTGLDCFDYFLSDVYCAGDAAAMKEYFTEKIIKLPHSHFCFEPSSELEPAPKPPCLKNSFVTFGSLNQFFKINDSVLIAWKKILDAVPNSRLLLKHKIFDTDDGKKFVGERLKSFGFDTTRVEMRSFTKIWLVDYNDVDIALDTFPYTGGVTTCEALYMGVPVVTFYGGRHGTRIGYSILKNIELDDLATDSIDDYIKLAVALAGRWNLLAALRKNLRGMMKNSPLMDAKSYARDVEKVFVEILDEERRKI